MGQCNYAASKAGVIGFSKSAAKDLAKFGIRCNAILPGFIETSMVDTIPEKVINGILRQIPLARMGRPEGMYSPDELYFMVQLVRKSPPHAV